MFNYVSIRIDFLAHMAAFLVVAFLAHMAAFLVVASPSNKWLDI